MAMDRRIIDSTALRFNVGDAVNVVFRRQPRSIQRRIFYKTILRGVNVRGSPEFANRTCKCTIRYASNAAMLPLYLLSE